MSRDIWTWEIPCLIMTISPSFRQYLPPRVGRDTYFRDQPRGRMFFGTSVSAMWNVGSLVYRKNTIQTGIGKIDIGENVIGFNEMRVGSASYVFQVILGACGSNSVCAR